MKDARFVDLEEEANELEMMRVTENDALGRRASGLAIVVNIVKRIGGVVVSMAMCIDARSSYLDLEVYVDLDFIEFIG